MNQAGVQNGDLLVVDRAEKPQHGDIAVSYTHLDVYKRQDGKEGPGDRSGSPYLATRPQKPGYDGGTAQPAHCLLYTSRCV